jgi:hypothetical protein
MKPCQHALLVALVAICSTFATTKSADAQSPSGYYVVPCQTIMPDPPTTEPPTTEPPFKYCVGVMCVGSNLYEIVIGTGNTSEEATQDADEKMAWLCPNGVAATQPIDDITCGLMEEPVPIPTYGFYGNAVRGTWEIRGTLTYCDGSPGWQYTASGSTKCEAIAKARAILCRLKDPCKRAYLCYCILKQPHCIPCR